MSNEGHAATSSRRTIVKGAAWSVPVIAAAIAAPAASASDRVELSNYDWYFGQNQVGSEGNRTLVASTNINVNKSDSSLPNVPFTVVYTIAYKAYSDAAKTALIATDEVTFAPVAYSGANQETSTPLAWTHEFTADEWPPSGGNIWIEYLVTMALATTATSPVQTMVIGHADGYGSTNPYTASGYVSSW
ncbi:hypothetical protein CVS30_14495 [Arthrobacter psychrolactophilus]|uniref:Uncharacterized protein n=1 Tax=Arthrobacter psychrolactophilus TaxID=92442 RepID=A0A2V5JE50_9MICC|nr:hypothetical protein [Arthrobacter psychrolactophilus]PYI37607.1 hypothetical protein CVS30_14495 [Arthrobacter psychrolactophilus]